MREHASALYNFIRTGTISVWIAVVIVLAVGVVYSVVVRSCGYQAEPIEVSAVAEAKIGAPTPVASPAASSMTVNGLSTSSRICRQTACPRCRFCRRPKGRFPGWLSSLIPVMAGPTLGVPGMSNGRRTDRASPSPSGRHR